MAYTTSMLDIQFLSSFMNDLSALTSLDKMVSVDDFSDKIYYEIYLVIVDYLIDNKSPTYQDLKFKFKDDELVREIIELIEQDTTAPDDLNLIYEELCEVSRKDKLKQIGEYLQHKSVMQDSKSNDLVRIAEAQLLQVTINHGINIDTVSSIEGEYLKDLKQKVERYNKYKSIEGVIDLPTGYKTLDLHTLGLQLKNTWVLGGGTSDGKTQMAVQISNSVIGADAQVLYFMLEDDKKKLINRFIALRSNVPIMRLMAGSLKESEVDKAKQALTYLKQGDRLLIEDETFDINEILAKAHFAKLKYPGLKLVIIDHINLITDKSMREGNREREIGMSSKKLVAMAKKSDVAVLILQQVNTNPDERKSGLPVTVNDLRDCKSTSHDSAVTLMLHCPDKFNEEAKFSKKHTQIVLAKNRYGQVNQIIDLVSHANVGRFVEGIPHEKKTTTKI